MTIRTKPELLNLYADNVSGNISAEDLRDFVDSNLVFDFTQVTTSPFLIDVKADVVLADAGSSVLNLPPINDFKDRGLVVINRSGGNITIVPDGSETIELMASVTLIDQQNVSILTEVTATNWDIVSTNRSRFLFLIDTPNSFSGAAGQLVAVNGTEDALEFVNAPTDFLGLTDTPANYSGAANQHVTVNGGETGLVFTDAVDSFNGRTGAVVAVTNDYLASQINNNSGVVGASVQNALDQLDSDIAAKPDDFTDLGDTPANYSGASEQFVKVNVGETALEFVDLSLETFSATATGSTSQGGASAQIISGMTLTPGAGDYLAWFDTSWENDDSSSTIFVAIYANGVEIAASEVRRELKNADVPHPVSCHARITGLGNGQDIDVRWRRTGSGTRTAYERTLTLLKIA